MDIWEVNKLVIFIAFVVPGFISLKTYELLQPGLARDSSQQVVDAVAYSSINYALLLWPIYIVEHQQLQACNPTLYALFYVFVLLIAPIGWACAFLWLRKTQFFQKSIAHPTGKPWDYVFSKRAPYWVIATLNDGRQIAGRYDEKSFASSSPAIEQIYLEEAWVLNEDGGFERPRVDSAGIIILSQDIVTLELFHFKKPQEIEHDGKTATTQA
ncbi:DUF6338 family protein [Ectopseudomonas oleovorans]|uniref:Uncharacterized protein n=1 Tax=Ectopseudomonas oleovorans TaxID=301 RepID=A0A427H8B3_ECTOL|nr:DUF6338 family protein [Pseudomonas oleovorans]RRW28849.1 hypothetical protein EGJ44_21135 [Pseudomonas oleovorans]